MSTFFIHAKRAATGEFKRFIYNTEFSELLDESTGEPVVRYSAPENDYVDVTRISPDNPGRKSNSLKVVKIQMGLKCNYSCSYCLQATHNVESVKQKDYRSILESLSKVLNEDADVKFEFWGGEPLLYWKTMLPLARELRARYPRCRFSIITNGSLLNSEINAALIELNFTVSISHDGPGHALRGEDPLLIPEKRAAILELYAALRPKNQISFNPTMNRQNASHQACVDWFKANVAEDVTLGEGELIVIYDDQTMDLCFNSDEENGDYRFNKLKFIAGEDAARFSTIVNKMSTFIQGLVHARPSSAVGQRCGMDRPDMLAMNMGGEVLSCQNVSSINNAPNGESHVIGHIDDLENVRLTTSKHWSHRPNCSKCPVVQLCAGSCMFLDDSTKHWRASCNNAYTDNVVLLAGAIEMLTGFLPYRIEGAEHTLPEGREYIWEPAKTVVRKTIPIQAI